MRYLFCVLVFVVTASFAQKKKVFLSFKQSDVTVIVDNALIGTNPDYVKIDFELSKSIVFHKRGFYSKRLEVDPDSPFEKLTISLVPKSKDLAGPEKLEIELDTLIFTKLITNFNRRLLVEELTKDLQKGEYYLSTKVQKYPHLDGVLKPSGYKMLIEIVDSEQIRHVYKSPRFLLGAVALRYSLIDVTTNKVVFTEVIEGINVVKVSTTKGLVVSEKMKLVTAGAIKESVVKLMTRESFKKFVQSTND